MIEKIYYDEDKKHLYLEIHKDKNNNIYRESGPTHIEYYESGAIKTEQYTVKGQCHRDDGPAHIEYFETGAIKKEIWRIFGYNHRMNGPAIIQKDISGNIIDKKYYVDGGEPTDEEMENIIKSEKAQEKKNIHIKIENIQKRNTNRFSDMIAQNIIERKKPFLTISQ